MYYYIYVVVCFYSCFLYSNVHESKIINDIQQRYYIIRRLEKPVATLTTIQDKKLGLHNYTKKYMQHFKQPALCKMLREIDQMQSLSPFSSLWSDVLSYKYIDNQDFAKEILTVILLLYKDLILSVHKNSLSESTKKCLKDIDMALGSFLNQQVDILSMLNATNCAHKQYKSMKNCKELNSILTTSHTVRPIHSGKATQTIEQDFTAVHTLLDETKQHNISQANTMRFYYIQRLLKSMYVLSHQKNKRELVIDEAIIASFTCPWIKKYMMLIIKKKNVDPLFDAWSQLTTYDFINDETRVREFIQSIYVVYYCSLHDQVLWTATDKKNDLLFMYETLATLPVSELLDLLDDVVEQYDVLSSEYGLQDTSLSWHRWFKQYWWAAPIVIGSLGLTLFQHPKLLMLFSKS